MSTLDMHRSSLRRKQDDIAKDLRDIADISGKIGRKQSELGRTKSPSQQQRIGRDIQRLLEDRARAEKSLATHQKQAGDLSKKVADEEKAEQKKAAKEQLKTTRDSERAQQSLARGLAQTSATVGSLSHRVAGIEVVLLDRVRDEIAADPVQREHDIFLSYAGPDEEIARELYTELIARNVEVWFARAKIELGQPLTRQIDRGIASSRVAVILITDKFIEGRYWTEREMGAFISTRRRVIPVLEGVTREELARYSPLLTDLVGLSTEDMGFDEIAERIAEALSERTHD